MLHNREYGWPTGDIPGAIQFQNKVSGNWVNLIVKAFYEVFPEISETGLFSLHALQNSESILGAFHLQTNTGSWFMRISTRLGDYRFEQEITHFLEKNHVAINPILTSIEFSWKGRKYRSDLRPLIEGEHFNSSVEQLMALGSTLGQFHKTLKKFPKHNQVHDNQSGIAERHLKARQWIEEALVTGNFEVFHERESWAKENAAWLKGMVDHYDPEFHKYPDAQCIHGEVHPANVIFQKDDGKAVLVDFETSIHAFTAPAWDLSYFILRFVLRNPIFNKKPMHYIQLIEEAYEHPIPPLAMMMRQTCWYCIACSVVNRVDKDMIAPLSEYNKFVKFERQIKSMVHIM
jgi:hypothetical protein